MLENLKETPSSCRGFWSLFVTQFQGAFSDNVLKNLVVFMILGMSVPLAQQHHIGELVGALFSLPFILFSMAGGFLADKYSKRSVTIGVKNFEIFVMLFATAALALKNLPMELASVFFMGVHSAFFGPSKYGLLPELLPEKKLSWGNGLLEFGTFTAIILGTVTAAFMAVCFGGKQIWSGVILVALALAGLIASLGITRVPAADPAKKFRDNLIGQVFEQLHAVRNDRPLALAFAGNTYFNFLGALLMLNLFFYGANVLHVNAAKIGLLNVALALGIGLGSVAAGYLSGGKIEYGLVPFGAFGLSITSALLAIPNLSIPAVLVWLALLGFFGGFFIVPVSALLQHRPDKTKKGEVLAAANLLSFVGIFLASGVYYLLADMAQLNPRQIFLSGGALTLAGAILAVILLPDALIRLVLWVLTRTLYRIRIEGRDNIPEKGGALFVCNHVSFVDAPLLMAATDRQVWFIIDKNYYERWWMKPFRESLGLIPVSPAPNPRELLQSLQTARDVICDGHVVCIFAEGGITRTGELNEFHRGFERIMKNVTAPIVPVALAGLWGSIFSFAGGKFFWKWPRKFPYPVSVKFGAPLPPDSTPEHVQETVKELLNGGSKN
ncbi:MAG: MFS transporter [Verrucomicrobiota bacterium]|jgi:acyl-[acyl-carrier-protein]-phospholipid O-acyltransferase/long-chain-fatty-acid--[acyl-carrier-protein] ligase